ncbi:unnamed protein product, partial [Polarella glacialis]
MFAHEVIRDARVRVVAWVDAGDFVFLEDPAHLLAHRDLFGERRAVGIAGDANGVGGLPLQVFDLPQMRQSNWFHLVAKVVRSEYAVLGPQLCELGEGRTLVAMLSKEVAGPGNEQLWYPLPSTW